jgi:plastocyanin
MIQRTLLAIGLLLLSGGQAPSPVSPAAARTFNITARQWSFSISPSPFVVNAGDFVTLNLTSGDVQHGFFLERYAEESLTLNPGSTRTVTFTATTAGTFFFACTVSSCGIGHSLMNGSFVVNAAPLPPTISGFQPTSGSTAGGNVVLIEGANFQNGATVKFGDVTAVSTTVNSSTSISATAPAHAAGAVAITVTNPDSQAAVSSTSYVYELPGPAITLITPSTGPTSGGTGITIDGSNFSAGLAAAIGGLPLSIQVVNASRIIATTPIGPFDVSGSAQRDVTVTNADGRSATRTGGFTWTVPAPSITLISPPTVSPAGGTLVMMTGAGFTHALPVSVTFGGTPSQTVEVVDAVTVTAIAPARAEGVAEVVVQVGSAAARSSAFSYQQPGKRRRAVRR